VHGIFAASISSRSRRRPASARGAAGAAGLTLLVGVVLGGVDPAHATDVAIWPLFHYVRDDAAGTLRWSALGPLLAYERTATTRELLVRPLLRLRRDRDTVQADVLFPLAAARVEPGYESVRFLLFRHVVRENGARDTTLFPVATWRVDPEHGRSVALLPLFARLHGFLGFDEVAAVLFPLWLRVESAGVSRRWHPFPFVSTVSGGGAHGLRLWPLWGDVDIPGREHTRFVLWPFYVASERHDARYGDERRLLVVPFWASLDGPWRSSRGWGVLGRTHTVDRLLGAEAIGAPWPFAYRERALGEEAWRVERWAPLWGRSDVGGIRSRFWLWPVARTTDQDQDDAHYHRRDAFLVLWRDVRAWNDASGRREGLWTLFPLWRETAVDDRIDGQAPAIADALVPWSRGVTALWAPLWSLFAWRTGSDGSLEWSVAWDLVSREHGRVRPPFHLDLGTPADG
jgi:hypothetical protein